MVLEISATPYIFTFKLWDWGRMGLDGKPRPINIKHGSHVIQWERQTDFVRDQLVNHFEPRAEGEGWVEERTGLHENDNYKQGHDILALNLLFGKMGHFKFLKQNSKKGPPF